MRAAYQLGEQCQATSVAVTALITALDQGLLRGRFNNLKFSELNELAELKHRLVSLGQQIIVAERIIESYRIGPPKT